jgi:CubicO group peptidase (beta-lactamase class C family)
VSRTDDSQLDSQSRVDALFRAYQGLVPGASVAVLRDGVTLLRRAYGLANVEGRIAATPATNYRLASMTKQFTSAAILLLVEDGRLSIDDPVRRWLPTLPDATEGITIRHLLTHRSGIADYEDLIPTGTCAQLHDADVLGLLETVNRSYFSPGTSYRYSNSAYVLLALVVGRASGKDFAAFLHERIFQPLGMETTVAFESGTSNVAHRAFGYSATAQGGYSDTAQSWTRTDQSLTSATLGDGGIYSSIDDLAKWDAALGDARLLEPASLSLAFAAATQTDDPAVQYGFGWRITGRTRWHSGETIGFRNVIVRYPEQRFTVIVLTNRDHPPSYAAALAVAKIFLPNADAGDAARAVHTPSGPDPRARLLPR